MDHTFRPAGPLRGTMRVPGDKSISHRGLILGAMSHGRVRIRNCAPGADVASTASALETLGVDISVGPQGEFEIQGTGWHVPAGTDIDAGNSGTTIRLLAGAVAGRTGPCTFRGDASLSRRPMGRVAEPLRRMGATVVLAEGGTPPFTVSGGSLHGIEYELPVASAQVKGAVLLAGLQAEGATAVIETHPSRDHTERLLSWLGIEVGSSKGRVELEGVPGRLPLPAFDLEVPGDFSSAAFWLVAACLTPGSDVTIEGVGLNDTRTGLLEVLAQMGASVEVEPGPSGPEPSGSIRVRAGALGPATVEGDLVPRVIDELPLVALAATRAEGTTVIRGAAELRVKESDRIHTVAEGLRALGGSVEELPDGLVVTGPTPLRGARLASHRDHRLALTWAVASLAAGEPVIIEGWEATGVSYPGFEEGIARLTQ
jgi:3-phosphoshikimate 1-carboxyvinyltransferase